MGGSALRSWILGGTLVLVPIGANAQMLLRPAERPTVTAGNERWFLEGQALTYSGNFYYPAGATVFFNANEMVRTGAYRGIPLYVLKTREPFAVVFVPIGRGLMQPYERRRAGDLAGTVGSTAPSFPVERDVEGGPASGFLQAAAPPFAQEFTSEADFLGDADSLDPRVSRMAPAGPTSSMAPPRPPLGSLRSALTPVGLNAFFINYDGRRWFSGGRPVLMDPATFSKAGDYRGFATYVRNGSSGDTIYIPVVDGQPGLLTPYSIHR